MDIRVPFDQDTLALALYNAAPGDTILVESTYDASVEGPQLLGKDVTIAGNGGRAKLPAFGILGENTLEIRDAAIVGSYTDDSGETASIFQLGGGLILDDVVFSSTKSTAIAAAFTWIDARDVVAKNFLLKPVVSLYAADAKFSGGRFEGNARNAIVANTSTLVVDGTVFASNTDLVDETGSVADLAHASAGADILAVRTGVTLIGTTHTGSSAGYGGALLVIDGSLDVSGSTFTDTEAILIGGAIAMGRDDLDGDGIEDGPGTRFTIADTTFTGTRAGAAGAIAALSADGDLRSVAFSDTRALYSEAYGGAEDELVAGGAIVADGSVVKGQDVRISGASADEVGGAILLTSSAATFQDLEISGGFSGYGGAIAAYDTSLDLSALAATANSASFGGAVLAVSPRSLSIRGSLLCDNESPDGAGLVVYRGSPEILEVVNTRIVQNTGSAAVVVRPDGETANAEPLKLQNVTFAENGGPAIESTGSPMKVLNGLFVGSTKGILAESSAVAVEFTGFFDVGTPLSGISPGEGVDQAADPKWTQPVSCEAPLWLGTGSPARDAGDPDLTDPDGTRSDMGAWGGPGSSLEDADGDGTFADLDCDDADADVFPGAPEVWYDGVDGDCAGGDDMDQDGDGYGLYAGDCDDRDPLRNPDTAEIENDRIDQDCDGIDNGDWEWLSSGGGCSTTGSAPWGPATLLTLLLARRRARRPSR